MGDTGTHDATGRAVVIGLLPRQLPERLRDHPRVAFWGDADKALGRQLPSDTGMVLFTKWTSHKTWDGIVAEARRRGVPVQGPLPTGRLRQMLAGFIGEGVEASRVRAAHGAVLAFVQAEADLAAPTATEVERLWGLAQARGFVTTAHSLRATFWRLRREQRAALAPAAVTAPTLAVVAGAAVPTDVAESVRVLDDGLASFGLVREELLRLVAENARLVRENQALAGENQGLRTRIATLAAVFQAA